MPDTPLEVRQRNRRAVQRLFAVKQRTQSQGGQTPTTAPAASSLTLSTYHSLRQGGGAAASTGPQAQPAWVRVSSRGCLAEPSLDIASHLSQQLRLSAELSPDGVTPAAEPNALDPKHSCFALHLAKHQHRVALTPASMHEHLTRREREQLHREQFHHQQAILRNESALARKRASAAYTSLTAAQADAAVAFPNAHTLDRLTAEKYAGGRWLLDNPHRQQLLRGVPVMTQVMRGDFYESHRGRQADDVSHSRARSASASASRRVDAQRANKRDVRVASAINASVHRSRSCGQGMRGRCPCPPPPMLPGR